MTNTMKTANEQSLPEGNDHPERQGLCHIYTGNGKGKTTASVGLLVRATGAGMKTLFCQFLKGRDTGELEPLRKLGVEVLRAGEIKKFFAKMTDDEKKECVKSHEMCYNKVKQKIQSGDYGLIVLDEVMAAVRLGLVPLSDLAEVIRNRPKDLEIVLTGRDVPEELAVLADYLSEIQEVRHPFAQGISARKGIEY